MRLLIALLLLVNALLLAMTAGLLPRPSPEAARAAGEHPLRPERLRIIGTAAGPEAPAPPSVEAHDPKAAQPLVAHTATEPEPTPPTANDPLLLAGTPRIETPPASAAPGSGTSGTERPAMTPSLAPPPDCLQLTGVDPDRLPALKDVPRGLTSIQIQERTNTKTTAWRVLLPPQGGAAAANRRLEQLRLAGVEDYFVIRDPGPLQWGISLGLFRSRDSAEKRIAELRAKKVEDAQIVEHRTTVHDLTYLGPQDAIADLRQRIRARFPQIAIDTCPP